MAYLILSILFSCLLFVYFKLLDRWKVNLTLAIVFNYISCMATGAFSSGFKPHGYESSLIMSCMALGFLFFGTFYLMGYSSAKIGLGPTGAATKLSLVIPVIVSTLHLKEAFGLNLILSVLLAIAAILLMNGKSNSGNISGSALLVPLGIFLGSGVIDTLLGILNHKLEVMNLHRETAIIFIFAGALIPGSLSLGIQGQLKKFELKGIAAGLGLGFINFFSVRFMFDAMTHSGLELNRFFPVNNMGVAALSFAAGILLWKEEANWRQWAGLALCLLSITLIFIPF